MKGDSTIVDSLREVVAESRQNSTCIVDLVAALRSAVQRVDIVGNTYRLEKEKVAGAVLRISLNQLNPRHQKIFKLFCKMVKIGTSS